MTKQELFSYIEKNSQVFTELSDRIWGFAELSLKEFQSMQLYVDVLQREGFQVETGLCGVPTAFSGSFGSGRPIIGILGEFDALSGLSQEAGVAERRELVKNGSGHGCGHNLLGAGSLAAAFAVKEYLQKTGKPGTVVFYGCPGEEGGAGKAFM
ncbi:MAG: M20/M25/M40 family metallo-hydrolase, partial [Christensenellaceae bacterium]|nr:M20/M25/M40 family metallo-hydrolase [Christensenellaceae bacterium]